MSGVRRELENQLLDTAADLARRAVSSGGERATMAVGRRVACRQLARAVSQGYPLELARHIRTSPGASSSSLFLRTIKSLSENAQGTARVASKVAPYVGKYFAVVVDPALTWVKMTRDDHPADEVAREVTKSLLLGLVRTSSSAFLGPAGPWVNIGIDVAARHLRER